MKRQVQLLLGILKEKPSIQTSRVMILSIRKEFYNPEDFEATKSVLLPKQIRDLDPENEKINLLQEQTLLMDVALEDMKRNREEARKQLEARFQDVYRKIENTKEFIISEGARINGTLWAFQSKFENELKNLDEKHQKQHDDFKTDTTNNIERVYFF